MGKIDVGDPPQPVIGLDGTFYEFTLYSSFSRLTILWWSDRLVKGWRPLLEIKDAFMEMKIQYFER